MSLARIFVPFAFGYFLSYLSRVVNAVIAPDLVRDLDLDAGGLGFLTSAYFLAFAAFQIPLGVLLDRFGPRRTNAALLLAAAAGSYIFAAADDIFGLTAGRAMIGFGVSGALMGGFKAFRTWFPIGKLPSLNGRQLAAGGLGALTGTVPVEVALELVGWRGVFVILGTAFAIGAACVYAFVPRGRRGRDEGSVADQFRGFARIFSSPLFLRVAPMVVTAQAAFIAIQSLWSGPWLTDVAGRDRATVATYLLLIACAMVIGFLLSGWIAERAGRRGVPTIHVALAGMCLFIGAQGLLVFQWVEGALLAWLAFGFFGTGNALCYAALTQYFPAEMAGRVNTGLNLIVFGGAFVCQWGIGLIIGLFPPNAHGGYAAEGYRAGFGAILTVQILALVWYALYRKADVRA